MAQNLDHLISIILNKSEQFEVKAMAISELRDLTTRQLHCLEKIADLNNPTSSELAVSLGITKPSVTAIIEKLAEKDYVEKVKSDGDRRMANIHLTKKGMKASKWHDDIHRDFASLLARDLSGEELFQLEKLLGKIVDRMSYIS